METFSTLLAFCVGNSPVTGEFPTQRPVTQRLFSLICAWANSGANNGDAGDLRRHRALYDVIVMIKAFTTPQPPMVACHRKQLRQLVGAHACADQ